MIYVQLIGGFLLLVAGGELLVRGAVSAARRLGVSSLMIGLTLVGFGTSTPELLTSVQAALAGSPGIAVGNVVGSNIANILLILGVGALIYPMATSASTLKRDGTVMTMATLLLAAVALYGMLTPLVGLLFLVALTAYVVFTYFKEKLARDAAADVYEAEAELATGPQGLWAGLGLALAGLLLTLAGARFLVEGAVSLAANFGISESIIGLTVVAVGTSLPELVTSVMASLRKQADVAFGNIIGSNIFNILGILGVTALIKPVAIPQEILAFDIWAMLGVTALLLVFAYTGFKICRREAAIFLALYIGYVGYLASIA